MSYLVDKIAIPFMKDTYLHRFKSGKKDELVFLWKDVNVIVGHKNPTQAFKAAKLIEGDDYVIVSKSKHLSLFEELTNLKLVPNKTNKSYFIYESGFWKLMLASKLEGGIKLKNWLASDVLPSIRKNGYYRLGESLTHEELMIHTNETVQKENSKAINTDNYNKGGVPTIVNYNIDNCKQVTGKTPSQIRNGSYKSAKQVLRETNPELASTMSLNDHLVLKKEIPLEELKQLDIAAINLFKEFSKLGIRIVDKLE